MSRTVQAAEQRSATSQRGTYCGATLPPDYWAHREIPWLGETVCNCTAQLPKSPLPAASNPSRTHVGRMPVWLPYVGWRMKPYEEGDPQVSPGLRP